MTAPRARGEGGQVGGVEAVIFGVMILVVGVLLVANAWGVVDAKTAAADAAREAARAYVTAPAGTDPAAAAAQAATDTLTAMGWAPRAAWGGTWLSRTAGTFTRCDAVTYRVRFPVPAFVLPWRRGPAVFWVASTQTERVDPYRSGIPAPQGGVAC